MSVTELLQKFICDISSVDFSTPGATENVTDIITRAIEAVCGASGAAAWGNFNGVKTAVCDLSADSQGHFQSIFGQGVTFAAKVLVDALAAGRLVLDMDQNLDIFSFQLLEPDAGRTASSSCTVTRLQCLEVLAAGFFGLIRRGDWGKRKHGSVERDMPMFTFEKLWQYDSGKWNTKNFVLMGVLLYFWQASRVGEERLQAERLTITRKALGVASTPDSMFFCPFELQQDKVSIHDFVGAEYLQADFANEYLGGGVMSGGGSQEESMFVEHTELLVTLYLVEKMLPFEAVEITGARKYVEHNMMAGRHLSRDKQFCVAADVTDATVTAVAMDAICFNAYGSVSKDSQYQTIHIQRELRKCLAALGLPPQAMPGTIRSFVTGNWGCGAFRGDMELKCIIQWIACSMEPSVNKVIYCPFDQHQKLTQAGIAELSDKLQRVTVRQVLDLLIEDRSYLQSPNTFSYLLGKLSSA